MPCPCMYTLHLALNNVLILSYCSGPSLFMVLSKEEAVLGWRALMGPKDPTEAKDSAPDT